MFFKPVPKTDSNSNSVGGLNTNPTTYAEAVMPRGGSAMLAAAAPEEVAGDVVMLPVAPEEEAGDNVEMPLISSGAEEDPKTPLAAVEQSLASLYHQSSPEPVVLDFCNFFKIAAPTCALQDMISSGERVRVITSQMVDLRKSVSQYSELKRELNSVVGKKEKKNSALRQDMKKVDKQVDLLLKKIEVLKTVYIKDMRHWAEVDKIEK
mmetsp:Transcript_26600/g.41719  ORF Transcript_26600/g.41719 Transcript_26600/m.41719 type:complete len:208 (+) Transcript_26600:54-677(+)